MGPKQSATQQSHHATPTIPHPRFDKVKFLNSRDREYLQISVPVVSESEVKEWHKSYKSLLAYECLLLPLSHQFKGTQMCGSSGLCEIKFDNYPFLLEGQISDRTANEKKYFQNSELLYLCLTILQAANIFHSQDSKIGDVRPLNVFINENGQAKIANGLTWPHETTNYEKTVYEKEITYLAPEEIKYEYFGHTEPKVNIQVSQSFSVGLTLLDSALLGQSYDLYNIKNNRFDYELLQRRINELFALPNYDQTVKKIIAGLCHINHQERLKCREVFAWLNQYRDTIINIQPFRFEEIPQFLITPVKSLPVQSILRPAPPIYFESQVIAHHPQTVLASTPLRFATFQQNNGNYVVQRVENRVQRVVEQPKQIIYVKQRAAKVAKQGAEVAKQGAEVAKQGAEVAKQGAGQQNQEDFKLTLSKIEQQLEMSRRMFPS